MIEFFIGVIDGGYSGQICVILFNANCQSYLVKKGAPIAQMIFLRYETPTINMVNDLTYKSGRQNKGFGSSYLH